MNRRRSSQSQSENLKQSEDNEINYKESLVSENIESSSLAAGGTNRTNPTILVIQVKIKDFVTKKLSINRYDNVPQVINDFCTTNCLS